MWVILLSLPASNQVMWEFRFSQQPNRPVRSGTGAIGQVSRRVLANAVADVDAWSWRAVT
jgi:hypothetical protein